MGKQKVLLISGTWPPAKCGVGRYAERYYSKITSDADFEICVLTSHEYRPAETNFFSVEQWRLRDLPAMIAIIKKVGPDIVHIQYPTRAYKRQLGINLLPLILRLKRIKTIVTMHEFFQTSLLGRTRSLLTIGPARKIVVSNEADFSVLPGYLRSKLKIIPISSTLAPAKTDKMRFSKILEIADLDKSKQTVVFFGLPFANKRLEVLVEAANHLSDKVQLLLPIETDDQNDYASTILAKAKELKTNGAPIGFTGFLNDRDMGAVLAAADYFVLPQTAPPLTAKSSTAIAAAENGCVIIAAATWPRDFSKPFVSGKNCWLLEDLSPESLAKTISELAAAPARRQKLASGATKLAKYFDWENVIKLYSELYKELAK